VGDTKGKFAYMSPEQARGEEVDRRTDVFALGVVLWEAITGRRLFFRENSSATLRALMHEPIPRPSSLVALAPELESIIMHAIARDRDARYATAWDLARALQTFVVSAGGASAGELGTVMKSVLGLEYGAWQQSLRVALSLPAMEPPVSGATNGPATVDVAPVTVAPHRRRPSMVLAGCALLALSAGGLVGHHLRSRPVKSAQAAPVLPAAQPSPVPAHTESPPAAEEPAQIMSVGDPLTGPGEPEPGPPSDAETSSQEASGGGTSATESDLEPPRDQVARTWRRPESRRRHQPAVVVPKLDRRPNPF
jgi:serine/threonine-protein kinase